MIDDRGIRPAENSLSQMLREPSLEGRRFLEIGRANHLFRSPRLSLVCLLLRLFQGVLLKVYRLRDRLIVGADTAF